MAGYVTNEHLTLEYIQTLITRCGFTDVSEQYSDSSECAWIDLNGNTFQSGLITARDVLILQHLVQQNS